ncbi:histidine phosphatase family protein [Gimesia panareensis]|uniref:Phosphoserine phosphatase 1 n=1 Tax=Gimesia panareensis TaxID=2527978 RepID=A0A518A8W9_9PLAN|nr:histidine phosphatase family protein [Gimesia panareensis]QDT28306.1 Phosphoserine phosphatase 1 [Gimesia panareensis]QDU51177.1 Phosphoserine phosphatase 1 [Gimesia panareensis]
MEPNHFIPRPEPGVTNLVLIRHGATPPNEQRPFILQGCGINPSLSESGQKQVQALADFLAQNSSLHHVYCSPMIRAKETAQAVSDRFGLIPQEVPEIHECDVGLWEGKSWDIISEEFPESYRAFMDDPYLNRYEGGESYGDVFERCEPALRGLLERHAGETIAVVAHNVVNRVYLASLLGLPIGKAKQITQTNTGINIIQHREGESKVVTINSIFHLNRIPH